MVFVSNRHLALMALATGFASLSAATPIERSDSFIKVPISKKSNGLKAHELVKLDKIRGSSFTADASTAPAVNADVTYTVEVTIGTQTFNPIVDTGSSNLWVGAQTKYVKDSTGTSTGDSFTITYGSGSVKGTEYKDKVTVGSATVTSQYLGAATSSSGFTGYDGILGLGPVDLTSGVVSGISTEPTFMDNLKSTSVITTEVLGVHFAAESGSDTSDQNGSLDFGGVDSTLYTGSLTYVPKSTVSPYSLYWGVDVGTITYGSTTLLASGDSAIVDTGTTLIYLPVLAYNKFLSATGGSTDSSSGLAIFSTKPTGTVTIHIGSGAFTLTPAQYLVPTAQYDYYGLTTGKYYSWINNGGDFQALVNFIIGQKFLENYYSVYDTTNSRVGFATAA